MSLLFETIKCYQRCLFNLPFHQERFNRARKELFGAPPLNLAELLSVPDNLQPGLYRCRVVFGETIGQVDFHAYEPRITRSLKIICADDISYDHKYEDRRVIDRLFSEKGGCDDILIVKNQRITDSSMANIVFFDGLRWVTPSTPLLKGTQRAKLLTEGKIAEQEILLSDIRHFKCFRLINAMREFDYGVDIPVGKISL